MRVLPGGVEGLWPRRPSLEFEGVSPKIRRILERLADHFSQPSPVGAGFQLSGRAAHRRSAGFSAIGISSLRE
jgi:hypothetical protein